MSTAAQGMGSNGASAAAGAIGRRSGRRPGLSGTRGDILRAARKLFAENGYQGATMRAIAHESKVDAALIHHFFLSKEGIFSAAVEDAFDPEAVVSDVLEVGDVRQRGERLVRVFLRAWESPEGREPLIAVLRSAMSHPDAARLLGEFVSSRVLGRIVRATSPNHRELRAMLIGSQVIGLVMLRFVLRLEPIASASDELIVTSLAPTIQRYLTGDISSASAVGPDPKALSPNEPWCFRAACVAGSARHYRRIIFSGMEFHLFLPQMRMSFERLVASARAAETAGFRGIAGMDHLNPPGAESHPMYEAMVTNTWLAAHTERLKVGSLVLCDALRHPAVLAREAVSLDHASGGRFELGIGWGSWPGDFGRFGVRPAEPPARVRRLRETLEVLRALWAGETVDYEGEFHHLGGASQAPGPLGRIPVVVGGAGRTTLSLVREFADWWNVPVNDVDRLAQARPLAGDARVSIQQVVAYVDNEAGRASVAEAATRRFGGLNPVIGTGPELVDHFGRLEKQGVERVYAWFCDFAAPDTLAAFGAEVIGPLSRQAGCGEARAAVRR